MEGLEGMDEQEIAMELELRRREKEREKVINPFHLSVQVGPTLLLSFIVPMFKSDQCSSVQWHSSTAVIRLLPQRRTRPASMFLTLLTMCSRAWHLQFRI